MDEMEGKEGRPITAIAINFRGEDKMVTAYFDRFNGQPLGSKSKVVSDLDSLLPSKPDHI